jgi:CheY-like chemotaxis protein
MLIDDTHMNLMPLEVMLEEEFGIKFVSFERAWPAFEYYKSRLQLKCCTKTIRLVLTDIAMPEMDGYELCRLIKHTQKNWFENMKKSGTLRATKAYKKCPVVAITSYTALNVATDAKAAGMDEVIHKPVSFRILREVLKKWYFSD